MARKIARIPVGNRKLITKKPFIPINRDERLSPPRYHSCSLHAKCTHIDTCRKHNILSLITVDCRYRLRKKVQRTTQRRVPLLSHYCLTPTDSSLECFKSVLFLINVLVFSCSIFLETNLSQVGYTCQTFFQNILKILT